jgi:hypothetical protein
MDLRSSDRVDRYGGDPRSISQGASFPTRKRHRHVYRHQSGALVELSELFPSSVRHKVEMNRKPESYERSKTGETIDKAHMQLERIPSCSSNRLGKDSRDEKHNLPYCTKGVIFVKIPYCNQPRRVSALLKPRSDISNGPFSGCWSPATIEVERREPTLAMPSIFGSNKWTPLIALKQQLSSHTVEALWHSPNCQYQRRTSHQALLGLNITTLDYS